MENFLRKHENLSAGKSFGMHEPHSPTHSLESLRVYFGGGSRLLIFSATTFNKDIIFSSVRSNEAKISFAGEAIYLKWEFY